jgi:hypothetical protein
VTCTDCVAGKYSTATAATTDVCIDCAAGSIVEVGVGNGVVISGGTTCTACAQQESVYTDGFTTTIAGGYDTASSFTDCSDVDECDQGIDECDSNAVCTNAIGSYSCECNTGFAGDGILCIEVRSVSCKANERASSGRCVACEAGKTRAAGDPTYVNNTEVETQCAATICKVNEKVHAHTCVACPPGTENPLSGEPAVGDDASGADTECTNVQTTGKCRGNTDSSTDVTCPSGFMSKPDPTDLPGTTVRECCDFEPEDEPEVKYRWQATAWGVCELTCGARAALTRDVKCIELTVYSNGAVERAVATNATTGLHDPSMCTTPEPDSEKVCPTLVDGTRCDDENILTTGDKCTAGSCVGTQVAKSVLTYPISANDVVLPGPDASPEHVTASPIGQAIKQAVELAVRASSAELAEADVTVLNIQAGSLVVDIKVELPASAVVDGDAKDAATQAIANADVQLTTDGTTVSLGIPHVEPLKTYAYSYSAGCSAPSDLTDCSIACDFAGEFAADVYQCLEDGAPVSADACVAAGIGAVPTSESTCCPAADPTTCEQSDAEVTAPPPCPDNIADSELSTKDKARCAVAALKEKLGAGVIVVIVIVIVAVLLCLVYKLCCGDGDDTGSTNDVEKDAPEPERRQDLEARLAKVREQQQGALQNQ